MGMSIGTRAVVGMVMGAGAALLIFSIRSGSIKPSVTQAIAERAVCRIVGPAAASGVRPTGMVQAPRGWVDGDCYAFSVALGKHKLYAKSAPKDVIATALVHRRSGRIVLYDTGGMYGGRDWQPGTGARRKVMDASAAQAKADDTLRLAGVSMSGMRSEPAYLLSREPGGSPDWPTYSFHFTRHVYFEGAGDVETPTSAIVELNAVTGELLCYGFIDQPIRVRVVPPRISEERAVGIVRSLNPKGLSPHGRWGKMNCQLCVGWPSGRQGAQRYFWRVDVDYDPPRRPSTAATVCVDAMAGDVLEHMAPCSK